jgi:hypothetical protein
METNELIMSMELQLCTLKWQIINQGFEVLVIKTFKDSKLTLHTCSIQESGSMYFLVWFIRKR